MISRGPKARSYLDFIGSLISYPSTVSPFNMPFLSLRRKPIGRLADIFVSFFDKNGRRRLECKFPAEENLFSIYFGKNSAIKKF
jgi:hypothetical protein